MPWYPLTCIVCGKTALYFNHRPLEDEIPRAEDARYPDGTAPHVGEMATCPHCGAPVLFAIYLIGPPEDDPFPKPHSSPPPSLREAADYAAYVLELASRNRSNDPENRRIYADAAAELRKAIERDEAAK